MRTSASPETTKKRKSFLTLRITIALLFLGTTHLELDHKDDPTLDPSTYFRQKRWRDSIAGIALFFFLEIAFAS